MVTDVIILAADQGIKCWPYNEVKNKVMIPIANRPIIDHNISKLIELGVKNIHIVCGDFINSIKNYYSCKNVECIESIDNNGTVDSLLSGLNKINNVCNFVVLYGDTIIHKSDLQQILESSVNTIMLSKLEEYCSNIIGCNITNNEVTGILAHPRDSVTHRLAAFHLDTSCIKYLENTADFMSNIQVGMMPIQERFIEATIADMIDDSICFKQSKLNINLTI